MYNKYLPPDFMCQTLFQEAILASSIKTVKSCVSSYEISAHIYIHA